MKWKGMIQNYNLLKIVLKGKDNLEVLATFKVRKFDLLFYKINTCLQKPITCIGLLAEQILSVSI